VRHLRPLTAVVVSVLGCAVINLTAETAVAGQAGVAQAGSRGAALHTTSARANPSSRDARADAAGCRRRAGRVCQASAKSPHRSPRLHARLVQAPGTVRAPTPTPTPKPSAAARGRLALITAVLATSCENTGVTPEPGNISLVREAVLCLINRERAQNGESPLKINTQLEQAAEGHSHELVTADYFAHVSPAGKTPVDRIREMGYIPGPSVGYVIGENLAWGTYGLATPTSIVAAWIASPGHLANILESQYTETGIGITPQVPGSLGNGAPGATYAQEFGVIVR
jgi:uncharacterized protein YkwD